MTDDQKALPDLQDATLSHDALLLYLDELIQAQVAVQVNIKGAARVRPTQLVGLPQLKEAVEKKEIHAAQLRYRYQGINWIDTVTLHEQGARLVRMQVA